MKKKTYIIIKFNKKKTACNLKPERECQTEWIRVEGAQGWTPTMYIRLVQDFGLDMEVALHLQQAYGDRAFAVAKMAGLTGKRWPIIGRKLHPEFPYIDAEVRFVLCINYIFGYIPTLFFLFIFYYADMVFENMQ